MSASLGRISVTMNALPVILPILYRVDCDTVWFFSDAATEQHAAVTNAVVAFEVDSFDRERGWSVLLIGKSFVSVDSALSARQRDAGLRTLAPVLKSELAGIPIEHITGRRFAVQA